jgi:hypothetical protein
MLLKVRRENFVVTAAHILDDLDTHLLYFAGWIGTQPV